MTASVSRPVEHGLDRLALAGPQRVEAERLARHPLDPVAVIVAGCPPGRGTPVARRLVDSSPAVSDDTLERPRLHFVGIGGAGMSGLALVARALGASVTGSDRAAGSPYLGAAARARGRARRGPRRRERAAGRRGRRLQRDPARQPGARDRPRARPARAAPRRPARRAHAAEADDRGHRHPRQDDDLEHGRPRAARLRDGPGLPGRRRGPLDRRQRRLGRRGSGSSSRPTSPTARC